MFETETRRDRVRWCSTKNWPKDPPRKRLFAVAMLGACAVHCCAAGSLTDGNVIWDSPSRSCASTGLQEMLLACDEKKILLLPAWPRDWDVDFKLHAPNKTTVECEVKAGKIVKLKVTPESRRKDVEFGL